MLSRLPIFARFRWTPNYSLWLGIAILSGGLQAAGLVPAWRYDRSLISAGELWLLFSGHLVHLNWSHWALNMVGLGMVAFFFSDHAGFRQWLWVLFCAALFAGVGLYWRDPDMQTYVGLSGVLHGLFIFGALREIRIYPASGYVLFILLVAKLTWEAVNGPLPGSETMTGGRVATDAHLYGAIGGGFAALSRYLGELLYQLVEIKNR